MRQVNPLVAALVLFLLLAFVIVRLEHAKESLDEARADLRDSRAIAERIVALNQSWGDSPQREKALQRLLASPQLRSVEIEKKKGRDTMNVSAKNMPMKEATYLLNKLLNGTYTIEKMDVSQVDDAHLRVEVEVAL